MAALSSSLIVSDPPARQARAASPVSRRTRAWPTVLALLAAGTAQSQAPEVCTAPAANVTAVLLAVVPADEEHASARYRVYLDGQRVGWIRPRATACFVLPGAEDQTHTARVVGGAQAGESAFAGRPGRWVPVTVLLATDGQAHDPATLDFPGTGAALTWRDGDPLVLPLRVLDSGADSAPLTLHPGHFRVVLGHGSQGLVDLTAYASLRDAGSTLELRLDAALVSEPGLRPATPTDRYELVVSADTADGLRFSAQHSLEIRRVERIRR